MVYYNIRNESNESSLGRFITRNFIPYYLNLRILKSYIYIYIYTWKRYTKIKIPFTKRLTSHQNWQMVNPLGTQTVNTLSS